jgi:nucleoside-diphosphate-sugar epimerase
MNSPQLDAFQPPPHIAVTGGSGFVGRHLIARLVGDGKKVTCVSRQPTAITGSSHIQIADYLNTGALTQALSGADIIVHLAARAHIMKDTASSPALEFRRANLESTMAMAKASASVGIKRFVFVSSIGVNGNRSTIPFKYSDVPRPKELYAISKFEAETSLRKFSVDTGLPLVIVRPPLVYGPGCPGNFARLLRIIHQFLPLPLASIKNRRSFISIRSLTDFLSLCITHPAAVNETFLVSDGNDVSTPELVRLIANAMGKRPNLWPFPTTMMKLASQLVGRASIYDRLAGDLQIDIEHTCKVLGWRPVQAIEEGIFEMVQAFMKDQR